MEKQHTFNSTIHVSNNKITLKHKLHDDFLQFHHQILLIIINFEEKQEDALYLRPYLQILIQCNQISCYIYIVYFFVRISIKSITEFRIEYERSIVNMTNETVSLCFHIISVVVSIFQFFLRIN